MPSVRGRERVVVAGLLLAAAGSTGALAGWVGGLVWTALLGPPLNVWALAALVVGFLALDAVGPRRLSPLSVSRQVPRLWGRVFSARVVAVLYGARLGVGPLTILRTWLWWAAFVAGASGGPRWSAAVGAAFGVVRIMAMLVAGTRAGGLTDRERPVTLGLGVAALVALLVVASIVDDVDPGRPAAPLAVAGTLNAEPADPERSSMSSDLSPASTSAPPPGQLGAPQSALAGALPDVLLTGWARAADDPERRLGPLDLAAAAAAERDTPAERALLETRHFLRGHARGWRGPSGQVGYASVYEFASPADAEAYLVDGVTTIEARGARVYDASSPAGGRGFSQAGQAAAGKESTVSHGVVFVRGSRFFLVFVSGNDSSVDSGDAAEAARSVAGS